MSPCFAQLSTKNRRRGSEQWYSWWVAGDGACQTRSRGSPLAALRRSRARATHLHPLRQVPMNSRACPQFDSAITTVGSYSWIHSHFLNIPCTLSQPQAPEKQPPRNVLFMWSMVCILDSCTVWCCGVRDERFLAAEFVRSLFGAARQVAVWKSRAKLQGIQRHCATKKVCLTREVLIRAQAVVFFLGVACEPEQQNEQK